MLVLSRTTRLRNETRGLDHSSQAAVARTDEASILRRQSRPKECSKDGPLGPSLENCVVMFDPLVVVPLRETCA